MRRAFDFLMLHFSFRSCSRSASHTNAGSSSIDVSALVVESTRRRKVDVKYGDKATTTAATRHTANAPARLSAFMPVVTKLKLAVQTYRLIMQLQLNNHFLD